MKITSLTLTAGLTVNLGNYESLRVDGSATAEIAPGDDLDATRLALIAEIRKGLDAQWREFGTRKKDAKPTEAMGVFN